MRAQGAARAPKLFQKDTSCVTDTHTQVLSVLLLEAFHCIMRTLVGLPRVLKLYRYVLDANTEINPIFGESPLAITEDIVKWY